MQPSRACRWWGRTGAIHTSTHRRSTASPSAKPTPPSHPLLLAERAVASVGEVERAAVEAGVGAGAQQLEEAAIWWGAEGRGDSGQGAGSAV